MSEKFKVGDKFLLPGRIISIDASYGRPINTVLGNMDTTNFCFNEADLSSTILIERDGVPVPAPGDLVKNEFGLRILLGIGRDGYRFHYLNNDEPSDDYCDDDYCDIVADKEFSLIVIGRNGELLPEKPKQDKKIELLRQALKIFSIFIDSSGESRNWRVNVKKELEGDEDE